MSSRRALVIVFCLATMTLLIGVAGSAGASGPPRFHITSTSSYSWTGALKVKIAVKGTARVETEPWNVCGGVPPGDSLKYQGPLFEGDTGFYVLVDGSGKTVAVCGGPPEVGGSEPGSVRAIPGHLAVGVGYPGVSCKQFPEEALSFPLAPEVTSAVATPGTAGSEESSFSTEFEIPDEYGISPTVCLTETSSYEVANQECARYFKPELCAKESGTYVGSIQSFRPRYAPTRAPGCGSAKTSLVKARRELSRASGRRAKAGIRRRIATVLEPREQGECG